MPLLPKVLSHGVQPQVYRTTRDWPQIQETSGANDETGDCRLAQGWKGLYSGRGADYESATQPHGCILATSARALLMVPTTRNPDASVRLRRPWHTGLCIAMMLIRNDLEQ